MSKALLKSKATRYTYGLTSKLSEIILKRPIRAAVVDPGGLKANWSLRKRPEEGAGHKREG